jgi:GNAT superfamily N-acetyltransferase
MQGDKTQMVIRAARPADAGRLAGVQLESALTAFAHIFPESVAKPIPAEIEAEWAGFIDDPAVTVLLAEMAGDVGAGVVFGDIAEVAPPGYGLLAKLYVRPELFGLGVGTKLYEIAVAELRTAGWERLWLWVLEGNTRARHMYERRGWVAQPERRTDWPGSGVFEMGYTLDLLSGWR